jgi:hypothetical protein
VNGEVGMNLYVETMDATVLEVNADGQVRLLDEGWRTPTFQERRAIIFAAENERAALGELLDVLVAPTRHPHSPE